MLIEHNKCQVQKGPLPLGGAVTAHQKAQQKARTPPETPQSLVEQLDLFWHEENYVCVRNEVTSAASLFFASLWCLAFFCFLFTSWGI